MTLKIFIRPDCHYCHKARDWLKKNKIEFIEQDIAEEDEFREEMVRISGQLAVPVFEFNEKVLIGFDEKELEKFVKKE
jgi:glutaredoxin 3